MAKTLAEINAILGPTDAADLTAIIKAVKDAVTASYDGIVAGVAAERDAYLAKLTALEAHLANPESTIEDVKGELKKTEKQRKRATLRAEIDKIEADKAAQVAAKQAELDKLDEKAEGSGKAKK